MWLGWVCMGEDEWGSVGNGLDGGLGSVGWVIGGNSCGQEMVLFTFPLHFFTILKVFGWVLGDPGLRLGSDWAPWLQIDVLGVTFGAPRPDFG
jgi:hypothetical protein